MRTVMLFAAPAALAIAVAAALPGCGRGRDPYFDTGYLGTVYNAADGSCTVRGQSFDFHVDGHYLGNLAAGTSTTARLRSGSHTFEAIDSRGETLDTRVITVAADGWYYWFGCVDGTHP